MSKALMKTSSGRGGAGSGIVPAIGSAFVPGLGQLINGEGTKALGVFVVWAIAGLSIFGWIPLIGTIAAFLGGATWLYGVLDAYVTGKKK
jgi:TM2 domain-containing membrane protein YozV